MLSKLHIRALVAILGLCSLCAACADRDRFMRAEGPWLVDGEGRPFVAIGENRINIYDPSWNWNQLSIDAYIRHMAEHGMTTLRVFIVSDIENEQTGGPNLGVLEPGVGRFDEEVAAQFDQIFRSAEAHGVGVILVAFALGFSQDDDWKSWKDNPYSKERGGPASTRYDFFESSAVRAQAAERIRYLARRYAPSSSLLAIDLLNEPEWDGAIPEVSWRAWAEEMARVWEEADPHDHPVTVGSVGLHWNIEGDEREWWASDACDIVQWHLYGKETYDVHALATEMTRKVRETLVYGKPVLVGEFAYGGEPKPAYDHTHVGLWVASLSGAGVLAHSAPPFNIDSDELMTPERASHYRVLRRVLTHVAGGSPVAATASKDVAAWALVRPDAAAVWLLAPRSEYGAPVRDVRTSVRGLENGAWRVKWLDDVTGSTLGETEAAVVDGELALNVPPFSRHVVGQLSRSKPGG